ncbi:MAG: CsgG/HfaB family protein [candidate division WOR-3 bacterium]
MRKIILLFLSSCVSGYYAKGSNVNLDYSKNYKVSIIPQLKSNYLNEDDLRKVYEAFYLELSRIKNFTIVEREKVEEILKELNFQYSGLVDISTAKEFGKLTGADLIASYEVISAKQEMDGFREIVISIKIINVQTGEIAYIGRGRGEGYDDKITIIDMAVSNSLHTLKQTFKK